LPTLAAGCDSERLARRAGLSLPIYPLKGYSLTAPISDPEAAPTLSVTDFQRKIVYARLAGRLRVAGIADIGGYDGSIAPRRLATLLGEAREFGDETVERGFDRAVLELDAGLARERGMDARRQRVRDRLAEHRVALRCVRWRAVVTVRHVVAPLFRPRAASARHR